MPKFFHLSCRPKSVLVIFPKNRENLLLWRILIRCNCREIHFPSVFYSVLIFFYPVFFQEQKSLCQDLVKDLLSDHISKLMFHFNEPPVKELVRYIMLKLHTFLLSALFLYNDALQSNYKLYQL